jgi:hypothetical protein
LWLALAAGEPLQVEESVLATYDLRAVLPRWDAGPSWSQGLLVPPAIHPEVDLPSIDSTHEYGELAAFELLDLLSQVLGDELRRDGRELLVEGSVLTVLAPPALHDQVRSILDGLEAALSGTLSLRVDVTRVPEGVELPRAGLRREDEAAKELAALSGRGASQESFRLELSAGRTARADAFERIPFLFDFDVQIAQGMAIHEPSVAYTRAGTRLAVRGVGVGGGLALSSVLVRSELAGPIETLPLTLQTLLSRSESGPVEVLDGPKRVQSPDVLVRALAFDTFLPEGQVLALTLELGLGPRPVREVVWLRRVGGTASPYVARAIPRTNRTLIALDAELFRLPRLTVDATPWHDDQGLAHPSAVASLDGEVSGFLLEWLKVRFSIWRRFGPWILIVTDPAWDRDAAQQLDRLVQSLRPSTALADIALELRAAGQEAVPARARLAVRLGSSAGLVLARGRTAVTGYGTEVATGVAVPDPFVSSLCDGLALALSVPGATLEASGMAQLQGARRAALDTGYAPLGPLQLSEVRVLRFDERVQLGQGRAGSARIGDASGFALELTLGAATVGAAR